LSWAFGPDGIELLSKGKLGLVWVLALVLVLVSRKAWHWHMGRLRATGALTYRTVIVGTNEEAAHIARVLSSKRLGYRPAGLVAIGTAPPDVQGIPVLGTVDEISAIVRQYGVDCAFIASTGVGAEAMKRVGKELRVLGVHVRLSANVTDILSSRLAIQPVGDLLAISIRPVRLTGTQAAVKRTFDLVGATVAVALLSPVLLAIGLAVKLSSRGPVFYKQARVGHGGREFTMVKFRSMVADAERRLVDLLPRNEAAGGVLFKLRDDPRVTRVGRMLRKWSLDELPQLFNVLKGDMSLVGPRPALPVEVAQYEDWHRDRLQVRPGITGLWQVGGRSELTFDDYVRLDLFYIENWSLIYDVYIIARTVPAVLFRKGAF